ncbi:alpha/beta fold hydrolase [Egbenema bharatensis]|uniref:alpha/beta fold hydrolase n=1 Tax=Egbenema bharatensis TaxID=3463334 RepID=UPI003A889F01
MVSETTQQTISNLPETQFYQWQEYRCAYEVWSSPDSDVQKTPLLLIHPIGVGLSRRFWDRFCQQWMMANQENAIYNPDLLGCGESDMPQQAYRSEFWAEQLQHFIQTIIQKPVIIVVQGALFPVAISLFQTIDPDLIKGMILAGPPAWKIMTTSTENWKQQLTWKILSSPAGTAFYRYARRRKFLRSFSDRQLFAETEAVDHQWLDTLEAGATDLNSRYAVFSFLAGFWRKDYAIDMANLNVPVLVVIGEQASSISRTGKGEPPEQRLGDYLQHLPQGQGMELSGRNVLPYESTSTFVTAITPFARQVETVL